MQERVAQVPHRSGLLKQTNKKHKTGGHRSKVSQMRPYRCKIKCKTKHANSKRLELDILRHTQMIVKLCYSREV